MIFPTIINTSIFQKLICLGLLAKESRCLLSRCLLFLRASLYFSLHAIPPFPTTSKLQHYVEAGGLQAVKKRKLIRKQKKRRERCIATTPWTGSYVFRLLSAGNRIVTAVVSQKDRQTDAKAVALLSRTLAMRTSILVLTCVLASGKRVWKMPMPKLLSASFRLINQLLVIFSWNV